MGDDTRPRGDDEEGTAPMIEGGNAGGSAQLQAAERRAHADRLQAEAARLDVVAGDERAMASRLAALPETYVILHDLTLPDGRGRLDHVVIGPGGAFLVVTRRVDADIVYLHGQLASGAAMLGGLVDAARAQAQALTMALGTPVVPVIGFVGAAVAGDVPAAVGGALVCDAGQVSTVISRGAHTPLTPTQVQEIADTAVPLLTAPGTRPRVQDAGSAPLAPPPPVPVAAAAPTAAASAERDSRRTWPAGFDRRSGDRRAPTPDHVKHSRRFVITAVVSACLVAFAAGGLLRVLFSDDPAASSSPVLTGGAAASTVPGGSTTIVAPTTAPGSVPPSTVPASAPVAAVPAPKVAVLPVCQTPGTGWSLVPAWPGDLKGLASYDVELLGPDGGWALVGTFTKDALLTGAITGQPPNVTLTVRFRAVMADGSVSPGTATPVLTPATSC